MISVGSVGVSHKDSGLVSRCLFSVEKEDLMKYDLWNFFKYTKESHKLALTIKSLFDQTLSKNAELEAFSLVFRNLDTRGQFRVIAR